eukprot:g43064.t1
MKLGSLVIDSAGSKDGIYFGISNLSKSEVRGLLVHKEVSNNPFTMPGKQGGKAKPLKQAKAGQKVMTDEDMAFKQKAAAEKKALADAQKKLKGGKK